MSLKRPGTRERKVHFSRSRWLQTQSAEAEPLTPLENAGQLHGDLVSVRLKRYLGEDSCGNWFILKGITAAVAPDSRRQAFATRKGVAPAASAHGTSLGSQPQFAFMQADGGRLRGHRQAPGGAQKHPRAPGWSLQLKDFPQRREVSCQPEEKVPGWPTPPKTRHRQCGFPVSGRYPERCPRSGPFLTPLQSLSGGGKPAPKG